MEMRSVRWWVGWFIACVTAKIKNLCLVLAWRASACYLPESVRTGGLLALNWLEFSFLHPTKTASPQNTNEWRTATTTFTESSFGGSPGTWEKGQHREFRQWCGTRSFHLPLTSHSQVCQWSNVLMLFRMNKNLSLRFINLYAPKEGRLDQKVCSLTMNIISN